MPGVNYSDGTWDLLCLYHNKSEISSSVWTAVCVHLQGTVTFSARLLPFVLFMFMAGDARLSRRVKVSHTNHLSSDLHEPSWMCRTDVFAVFFIHYCFPVQGFVFRMPVRVQNTSSYIRICNKRMLFFSFFLESTAEASDYFYWVPEHCGPFSVRNILKIAPFVHQTVQN